MANLAAIDRPEKNDSTDKAASAGLVHDSIVALQAGVDPELHFKRIFRRFYGAILNFFLKRGFTRSESHDLAQETFLNLHTGISSFRRDGYFEGWLFQIATNIYRNAIRERKTIKRQGQEESFDDYLAESVQLGEEPRVATPESPGPLDEYLVKERRQALADALEKLPKQMRRCMVLRIHHELKYREIASVMQISVETVKAHLYQARHRLEGELSEYFGSLDP